MASSSTPRIQILLADAAIAKGKPVKIGSDNKHVAAAAATSDKMIGIAQNAATAAGDPVEVALPGGGAKALSAGTISAGDILTYASGGVDVTTSNGLRHVAMAMEDAVSGDMFAVEVVVGIV